MQWEVVDKMESGAEINFDFVLGRNQSLNSSQKNDSDSNMLVFAGRHGSFAFGENIESGDEIKV
jgi:hypothetical protein